MRAALLFVTGLRDQNLLDQTVSIHAELFGSLGATGKGHGSDKAVLLGLEGEAPDTVDPDCIAARLSGIREQKMITLLGVRKIRFVEAEHLTFHRRRSLPYHPNGMRFLARNAQDEEICSKVYYSIGGGFVVNKESAEADRLMVDDTTLPYPFKNGAELLALCKKHGLSISQIMLENEKVWHTQEEIHGALMRIWQAMQDCVKRGCSEEGILPGGLKVRRRAAELHRKLSSQPEASLRDPLTTLDWVTAPTNGAAGIIPAVLHYYARFVPGASDEGVARFLLTAAAIGILYKENASISGAEVGCQGEVGVACSMAAGGLAEVMGGTVEQVENAAEIGMEHNLGLTCDPIGGLVQVPCIERNAMGSVKAINAARIALRGDGKHFVSLDKVIRTMRETGADMKLKYKETSRGGLAVNVIEC